MKGTNEEEVKRHHEAARWYAFGIEDGSGVETRLGSEQFASEYAAMFRAYRAEERGSARSMVDAYATWQAGSDEL